MVEPSTFFSRSPCQRDGDKPARAGLRRDERRWRRRKKRAAMSGGGMTVAATVRRPRPEKSPRGGSGARRQSAAPRPGARPRIALPDGEERGPRDDRLEQILKPVVCLFEPHTVRRVNLPQARFRPRQRRQGDAALPFSNPGRKLATKSGSRAALSTAGGSTRAEHEVDTTWSATDDAVGGRRLQGLVAAAPADHRHVRRRACEPATSAPMTPAPSRGRECDDARAEAPSRRRVPVTSAHASIK